MSGLALRLSVTDRCDLRCTYCRPSGGRRLRPLRDTLVDDEIERSVHLLARCGVTKVRITGGEPLMRPGIAGLLLRLGSYRDVTWTLTTNGQRLGPFVPTLRRAGFSRVNVSLDSLRAETFRDLTGGGDITRTLHGCAEAERAGFTPMKWNVVVLRDRNLDEVEAFARVTIERPVHVRFIELMPRPGDVAEWRENFVPASEILDRIRAHLPLEPCLNEPHSPARLHRIPDARGRIGIIAPMSAPFCETCNRLRLSATGQLYACLSREDSLDLRQRLRSGESDAAVESELRRFMDRKRRSSSVRPSGVAPAQWMSLLGG